MGESMRADVDNASHVPEITIMYCSRCVAARSGVTSGVRSDPGCRVRMVAMPCTSKVELPHVLGILESGVDAVQVVGCPQDRCRFLTGSRMAAKRIQRGRELLERIGMGQDRMGMHQGTDLTEQDLMDLARQRADRVRPLGPNPMKGACQR